MADDTLSLADLRAGLRVAGLLPTQVATVVSCEPLDADVIHVVVRDEAGVLSERYVGAAQAATLTVATDAAGRPPLDANPDEFRLAAEALRIKFAALYDPLAAVNSSDVQPLPHQIEAVYGKLLPQVPLRYVLADDPGAGKTIMAGLYIKELILRSDCQRCVIVAPGSLVDQWRDELSTKFGLDQFEVLTRQSIDEAQGRNVFTRHPYLIVRMDQVSRDDALMEQLADARWDVAVVDEAHRMSAHYWGNDLKQTRRYRLGQVLSDTAANFLMMTATPHAGKEDDFQLFMALLDPDRFEGQYREGVHRTDTTGLMIRRTKEELLTFDGKHLFPERRADTVAYELSPAELDLYEQVTEYVRTQMSMAQQISASGDAKRGNTIGFALTVLQRRLASSPEAILRSLERRRDRLTGRLTQMRDLAWVASVPPSSQLEHALGVELQRHVLASDVLPDMNLDDLDDIDSDVTDDERARFENDVEQVVDLATAAQTVEELKLEIGVLDTLVGAAKVVRNLDEDRKWVELRKILDDQVLVPDVTGLPRKIIVFTEHRDTLTYLRQKIGAILGPEAVVTIHGGMNREARAYAQTQFTS
ncbi:MAG: SNF2-related protein, partial [Actinomycetia bacterium]|nr:SNF2-related protein [Actinomycetes bacterium]